MDEKQTATNINADESVLVFRFKATLARLTLGLLYRGYWPYYNRGLAYIIDWIEMVIAKRVSKNFVNYCGLRLVNWAYEHEYPHDQLMEILSDYDTDMLGIDEQSI